LRVPGIVRPGLVRSLQRTRIHSMMNSVANMLISLPHRNLGRLFLGG
jgi:hypothetical protein